MVGLFVLMEKDGWRGQSKKLSGGSGKYKCHKRKPISWIIIRKPACDFFHEKFLRKYFVINVWSLDRCTRDVVSFEFEFVTPISWNLYFLLSLILILEVIRCIKRENAWIKCKVQNIYI